MRRGCGATPSELGEEHFNEIEPGTVRGREGELEAPYGLLCKPGLALVSLEICAE